MMQRCQFWYKLKNISTNVSYHALQNKDWTKIDLPLLTNVYKINFSCYDVTLGNYRFASRRIRRTE